MELILIDDRNLKIMLSEPDMTHYALSPAEAEAADPATRRAFRAIFHDACDRVGFDTAGERLLVRLFAADRGGCEIFVTKLGCPAEAAPADAPGPEARLLRRLHALPPATPAGREQMLPGGEGCPSGRASGRPQASAPAAVGYTFSGLAPLLALCRRLRAAGFAGWSEAYMDTTPAGREVFVLLLEQSEATRAALAPAGEYGEPLSGPPLAIPLTARLLTAEAVPTLGRC